MSVAIMRKQLQVKKLESELFEYEIKIQERLNDIERIKESTKQQQELISKIKEEIENMGAQ